MCCNLSALLDSGIRRRPPVLGTTSTACVNWRFAVAASCRRDVTWLIVGLLLAIFSQHVAGHPGQAPPQSYYPATANGETPTMYRGLPDVVVKELGKAGLPLGSFGLFVQAVDQPLPMLALNAEQKFVLASTAKVVTTLAALDLLGPAYRWRTDARLRGELVDGRLDGDLLIVGGGDARLASSDLLKWFSEMQSRGLREISGNIVLDRLAFKLTEQDQSLAPRPGPDRPHHNWPDALSLNDGVLRLQVQPAAGKLANLSLQPPLADVTLVNEVRMGRGCVAKAEWVETVAEALHAAIAGHRPVGQGLRAAQPGLCVVVRH